MPVRRAYFSEVEHTGDLDAYAGDLREAGVVVVGSGIGVAGGEPDPDTGWIDVAYAEGGWQDTLDRIRATGAGDYYAGSQRVSG